MPRPAPVTTATLPFSMSSLPTKNANAGDHTTVHWALRTRPRTSLSLARVERGDERAAEDEHDRGVVDEHHEGHQHAQRSVDLVVHADLPDVEGEEPFRDFPQEARHDGASE